VFPHLISGPIMRANEILPQLRRELDWHLPTFLSGLQLFVEGLVKKRLIADTAGIVADRVFAAPTEVGTMAAWIGALAYTLQIYGDFAGYTDMGRGIARMLGFELPFNFDDPYAASSITDFWGRWHISLSRWLRDYLYIPLGGNRRGGLRTYANLIATMLLGGLWHGAGWTFVAWGGYHGVLLALERCLRPRVHVPPVVAIPVTLVLVINGWVLFRAHDFGTYLAIATAMYVPRDGTAGLIDLTSEIGIIVGFVFVVGAMIGHRYAPGLIERIRVASVPTGVLYGAAFGVAVVLVLLSATPRPFIYFRF
jgi:alginate O-acetyltransferase complex protein AlgI